MPLVPDYATLTALDSALEGVASRQRIRKELDACVARLRRPFFELTAALAERHESLAWWAGSIAERNTNESDLFLHCSYLNLAADRIADGRSLCVVCDAPALRSSIAAIAGRAGYVVRRAGWRVPRLRDTWLRSPIALAKGLAEVAIRLAAVRACLPASPVVSATDVVISSWLERGSIDHHGLAVDRYFPGLAPYYREHSLGAITVFTVADTLRNFWRAIRSWRPRGGEVLLEQYLRASDLVFPLGVWLAQRRFEFSDATLGGHDVARLFRASLWTQPVSVLDVLHFPLMRRLRNAGVSPKIVMLAFENLITDKMAILGARRFMPGTAVYGFCHMPLKPNVLSCYTDVHERTFAPLPDRVISNGPRYRDILVQEHYPPERVTMGAALRYRHLHDTAAPASVPSGRRRSVLVVLTIKRDATLELLNKVAGALPRFDGLDVQVRPHPFARGHGKLAVVMLPGARLVGGTMREALDAADVVVCSASGAALDSALAGKPLIRVASETQLDMDPLGWFEEFDRPVGTSEELTGRMTTLLAATPDALSFRHDVASFFLPATPETMRAFLPDAG